MSEIIDIRYVLNSDEVSAESKKVDKAIATSQQAAKEASEDMRENIAIQKQVLKELEKQYHELQKVVKQTAPGAARLGLETQLVDIKNDIVAEKQALGELNTAQKQYESSTVSLRTQIMNLRNSMATMVEGSNEYKAAMLKLGELQDQMGDIQQQGRIFADDEKYFRTATEAVQGLAGAMSVGVGVASLFGASQDNLAKIQAKLQAVMAISIGVQQVAQVLNKDSYVSHILLIKVKAIHAAVQTKLTAALWGSAIAAKAVTIAITGGLIIAVWAIVAAYDSWRSAEDERKKKSEEAEKAQKDFNTSVVDGVASQLVAYSKLQKSWKNIGDNSKAQKKFISDNKEEIANLGVSIKSVAEAENIFVTNSSAFIESLMLQSKAAAVAELAVEKYKKIISKQLEDEKRKPQELPQGAQSMPGYADWLKGQEVGKVLTQIENKRAQEEFDKLISMEKEYLLQAKTLLDNAGINSDDGGGGGGGKVAAKDYTEQIEQMRQERQRANKDAELQLQQSKIDAMDEGLTKTLAQNKLNYDKEIEQINRQKKDKLAQIQQWERKEWEAQNPNHEKQGNKFIPTTMKLSGDESALFDQSATNATANYVKANNDSLAELKSQWQNWGDEYQQIEDKITETKANAAKVRKRIAEEFNAGHLNFGEARIALGRVDGGEESELSELNSQKTRLSASWASMFRDLQGMSRREVNKLIVSINEELKNKKLSAADASALLEQLGKAKEYSIGLNPFASWVVSLGDVGKATKKVEDARKNVTKVNLSGSKKEKAEAEQALQDAQKLLASAKERRAASTSKSLSDISNVAGATSDLLKTFGIESPAVDGVVSSLGSLASIDFTNPISIITGGLNAIASLLGGIFGETDAAKDKEIKNLQGQIDEIEISYEELGKSIEKAYSTDASQLIEQQNVMLENQKNLIKLQIAQEDAKKDSDDGKINDWKKQLDELDDKIEENKEKALDAIFGSDLKSAIDDFANAYVDAWSAGEDRAQSQKDVVKKMIQGIVTEIIKSNIADKVAALRIALKNAIIDGIISDTEQTAIDKLQDEIYAQSKKDADIYEKWLKGDKEENEASLAGQIRGTVATEASVAELGGIFRGQYDKLASIEKSIGAGFTHLLDIARTNAQIEANTRATAVNTAATVEALAIGFSAMQGELVAINKNTSKDNGSYGG